MEFANRPVSVVEDGSVEMDIQLNDSIGVPLHSNEPSEMTSALTVPIVITADLKEAKSDSGILKEAKLDFQAFPDLIIEPISPVEETAEQSAFPSELCVANITDNPGDPEDAQIEPKRLKEASSCIDVPKDISHEPIQSCSKLLNTTTSLQATAEHNTHNKVASVTSNHTKGAVEKSSTTGMTVPSLQTSGPTPTKDTGEKTTSRDPTLESSRPGNPGQTKEDKDAKKNIPPKRDRMDPLKLDMSKTSVMPLTSSQLSLQCLECHIIFSDSKTKQRHLKMSHPAEYEQCMLGDALFACYVCDRHFTCSSDLMAHQRAHKEKQPYRCPICGEGFRRLSELTLHKKAHFGKDGYTCSDCGKSCKTLTLLKYHTRTHTGDRPYVCKECGKRFSMPKALQKHLDLHTQNETEGIREQSNTSANSKKKRDSDASERKFTCTQCNATFKTAKTQIHHMKHKHSQNKSMAPPSVATSDQQLKQGPPSINPAEIGQLPVLRVDAVGPGPQQIETLATEQIKRLIESLENVKKVNQVVILGLDQMPLQTQPVGLQQPQAVTQTLPQLTIQALNVNQTKEVEGSFVLEQNKQESVGGAQQPEVSLLSKIQEEVTFSTEEQVISIEPERTQTQLDEIELQLVPVQSEEINSSEQSSSLAGAVLTEAGGEFISTIELEQIPVETGRVAVELEETTSATPSAESTRGQTLTRLGENVTRPQDIKIPEDTVFQMEPVCSVQIQEQIEPLVQMETHIQTDQLNMENAENAKGFENGKSQIKTNELKEIPHADSIQNNVPHTGRSSYNNLRSNQEKPLLSQPLRNEQEIQQSRTTKEDQVSGGSTEHSLVKGKVPARKPVAKKRITGNGPLIQAEEQVKKHDKSISSSKPKQANVPSEEKFNKRSRAKKSRLVVRFGPREKRVKSTLQRPSQASKTQPSKNNQDKEEEPQPVKLQNKEAGLNQKDVNNKKEKKNESPQDTRCKTQDPQVQQVLQVTESTPSIKLRKRKMKRQKDLLIKGKSNQKGKQDSVLPPMAKKKKQEKLAQEESLKKAKGKKTAVKKMKKKSAKMEKHKEKDETQVIEPQVKDQIKQQALLLLKGHKQPQLKVHKLDAEKTTGLDQALQTQHQKVLNDQETMPVQSPEGSQNETLEKTNQKKTKPSGKKVASPLLHSSPDTGITSAPKSKVLRKRKASTKIDQEIAMTQPYSQKGLTCQDCGQKFLEVSALQEHMASEHPAQTRALLNSQNSNPPTPRPDELDLGNAVNSDPFGTTDWDMEIEIGEIGLGDREDQGVSFPALNPSPSLPVAPTFSEKEEEKGTSEKGIANTAQHLPIFTSDFASGAHQQMPLCEEPSTANQLRMIDLSTTSGKSLQRLNNMEAENHFMNIKHQKPNHKEGMDAVSRSPTSNSRTQGIMEDQGKDEFPQVMNVVTVGDQVDNLPSGSQRNNGDKIETESSHNGSHCTPALSIQSQCRQSAEGMTAVTPLDATSCLKDQLEISQQKDNMLVHRVDDQKKWMAKNKVARGRKRGGGRGKRPVGSRETRVTKEVEASKETEECQIVYQLYSLTDDSGDKNEGSHQQRAAPTAAAAATAAPGAGASLSLEGTPEEKVIVEQESVTNSVVEVEKCEAEVVFEKSGELAKDGSSPGIVLERFQVSQERKEGDVEQNQTEVKTSERQREDDTADDSAIKCSEHFSNNRMVAVDTLKSLIKTEDTISNITPHPVSSNNKERAFVHQASSCEQQHRVQIFLVKEEDPLVLNDPQVVQDGRYMNISMEVTETQRATGLDTEDSRMGKNGDGAASHDHLVPHSSLKQCIFYPVKEEEREMLVGHPQNEQGMSEESAFRSGLWCPIEDVSGVKECQDLKGQSAQTGIEPSGYPSMEEGDMDVEQQNTEDLLEFLSQSSDGEDANCFHSEPEAEALILSCYHSIQSSGSVTQQRESGQNSQGQSSKTSGYPQVEEHRNNTWKPIDYFTQYFGWDTWREIAECTAKVSQLPNPATDKEVAQFVGIHIAMGTLKYPSEKLYWEDCTRVPLIADAMSATRFSELTCKLRLAQSGGVSFEMRKDGPPEIKSREQPGTSGTSDRHESHSAGNGLNKSVPVLGESDHNHSTSGPNPSQEPSKSTMHVSQSKSRISSNLPRTGDAPNCTDSTLSNTDHLWKVRRVVNRVQRGCQALRRNGNHGVDQYPLNFQRHPAHSLHHTVMVNVNGLIMDFSLSLDESNREHTVEKMVSRNKDRYEGTVFLCKPELSTPSMLEHLLEAGVQSAGKVGGARGQVGDEFVSSDGKLKLFRCHHGFILSAAAKGRSRSTSLVSGFERALKAANLNRDLRNLYRTPCTSPMPSAWPQSVLWDLTDLALVNSWLQYKQDQTHEPESLSLMAFRLEVAKALILSSGYDAQESVPPYPPDPKRPGPNSSPGASQVFETPLPDAAIRYDGLGHWPEQVTEGEEARCRFGGCERTSRVRCLKCCVFLCISRNHNCFLKFHSQGSI